MSVYGVVMGQHRLTIPERFNSESRSTTMSITARGPDFEAVEYIPPDARFYSSATFAEIVSGRASGVAAQLFDPERDNVE